jgi:predicted  nucleic acid-binding Zn ribbon protein
MQAYRITAELESKCSKHGRELCLAIEKATGVPAYYYLHRHYGREFSEEKKRPCPCCGKTWFIKRPGKQIEEHSLFWEFDFMCKRCRLVSNCAYTVEPRYAKIGEPRKSKK